MKFVDHTGKTFYEWTVLEYLGKSMWLCKCSCGTEKSIHASTLVSGNTKSCRTGKHLYNFKDLNGQKFNEWTVLYYLKNRYWQCQCSCGNITVVNIKPSSPYNEEGYFIYRSKQCLNSSLR